MLVRKNRNRFWVLVVLGLISIHCHRAIEPFEEEEMVKEPDLSRIFPSGMNANKNDDKTIDLASLPDPPPTSSFDPSIRGKIQLPKDLEVPEGAVLFVIARNTNTAGPPTAVKRFANPTFPQAFQIGPKDKMIQGTDFSGPFSLSARLDQDGNATTKGPNDFVGTLEKATPAGTRGVLINLRRETGMP